MRLLQALGLVASKLARHDVVDELHVFGGAAMVLAFDARAATRDVDARFEPDGLVLEAAREVADDLRLLLRTLHLHAVGEVVDIVGSHFPDDPLSGKSRQLIEDLLAGG